MVDRHGPMTAGRAHRALPSGRRGRSAEEPLAHHAAVVIREYSIRAWTLQFSAPMSMKG